MSNEEEKDEEQEKLIKKRLNQAVREVIDKQIYDGSPPETQDAMERLLDEKFTQDQAYDLIGMVVSAEIFEVIREGRTYDGEKYATALDLLPKPYMESAPAFSTEDGKEEEEDQV